MKNRRSGFEYITLLLIFVILFNTIQAQQPVHTGAEQLNKYRHLLQGKRTGLVVNQTSVIGQTHLVDTLSRQGIQIKAIFAPEHGFRGDHEAGAAIHHSVDSATGIPVVSLYGKNKKPTPEQLAGIDLVLFDIQDVGVRFYTYISTLHYILEACAEQNIPLIVLDRPNPNGFYTDGPVLKPALRSFVGMHPVPVVHGMTIGEYAHMINGEGWLKNHVTCSLTVIRMHNYSHQTRYMLPVKPSPNLTRMEAIYLYPTTCFLEGTSYSLGRGTPYPFECAGKPGLTHGDYEFTPIPLKGIADNPPHANTRCRGYRYTHLVNDSFFKHPQLQIELLIDLYKQDSNKSEFFNNFFDKLAGTDVLRKQIQSGKNAQSIRKSWESDLKKYRNMRKKYLLYE